MVSYVLSSLFLEFDFSGYGEWNVVILCSIVERFRGFDLSIFMNFVMVCGGTG